MIQEKLSERTVNVSGVVFAHKDIHRVVDDFYHRIQCDSVLQVPFRTVEDWPEHIQKLTHFWWIRFGGEPYLLYNYNPVAKHFLAGFNREFLTRWLFIFYETLQKHLTPEQATLWKSMSGRMGEALFMRNELLK